MTRTDGSDPVLVPVPWLSGRPVRVGATVLGLVVVVGAYAVVRRR